VRFRRTGAARGSPRSRLFERPGRQGRPAGSRYEPTSAAGDAGAGGMKVVPRKRRAFRPLSGGRFFCWTAAGRLPNPSRTRS